ncbi:MAG: phage tail tape measure protein [Dehalococcoidia bacterium]|nr:phage tail tape measure protein [Dehalococcoidia bacterium]
MTNLGTATLHIKTDESGVDKGFASVKQKAKGLGGVMNIALGTATGFVAAQAGMQAMSHGFDFLIGNAANFEASLGAVQAATGATEEQIAAMRKEALAIGKDTSKSASDAVLAMGELAKAGMSVETILGGAGRSAVQLAEATGIEVPQAAVLMSNALNTFSEDGLKADEVANIFARTAVASAIDVNDLGMSMAAVGPIAAAMGLSLSDTATFIGIMGNAGIKGSDAGTSLKAMLNGLTPVTDKAKNSMEELGFSAVDTEGNFKSMPDIIANLDKSMEGLTEAQKMATLEMWFGTDGQRAALVALKANTAGWDDFNKAVEKAPSVAEQSEKRLQGLNGAIEILNGTIETLSIIIGTIFLVTLADLVTVLSEVIEAVMGFKPLSDAFNTLGEAIEFVTSNNDLMLALAIGTIPALAVAVGILAAVVWGLAAAVIAATWPFVAIGLAIAAVAYAVIYVIKHFDEIKAKVGEVVDWILDHWLLVGIALIAITGPIGLLVLFVITHFNQIKDAIVSTVNAVVDAVMSAFNAVKDTVTTVVSAILQWVKDHWKTILVIVLGPLGLLIIAIVHNFDLIKAAIKSAMEFIGQQIETAFNFVKSQVETALTFVVAQFNTAKDFIFGIVIEIYNFLASQFQAMVAAVSGPANEAKDALVNAWNEAKDWVSNVAREIVSTVEDILRELVSKAGDIGRDAGKALVDGLSSIPGVKQALDVGGAVTGVAKSIFGSEGWASGGRPPVGQLGIFGEEGPELWVPDEPGTVLSHEDSMAALGQQLAVNYYGPVKIMARDELDAERGAGDSIYGLRAAARSVGLMV